MGANRRWVALYVAVLAAALGWGYSAPVGSPDFMIVEADERGDAPSPGVVLRRIVQQMLMR